MLTSICMQEYRLTYYIQYFESLPIKLHDITFEEVPQNIHLRRGVSPPKADSVNRWFNYARNTR